MKNLKKQINSKTPLIGVKKNKEGIYDVIYGKTFVKALKDIKTTKDIHALDIETTEMVIIDIDMVLI